MTIPRRRSPRERRLQSDLRAMQELAQASSIIEFETRNASPDFYRVIFHGKGLWRPNDASEVLVRDVHEVAITLTSAYPRMIPELAWQSPVFHPNISASGVVCLGGYGTHWVPSLMLDELCHMLWDMIRYKNFDIESPYNREAAVWTKHQEAFSFPIDHRPLKNQIQRHAAHHTRKPMAGAKKVAQRMVQPEVQFIDNENDSEVMSQKVGDNDIVFIE